MAAAESLTITRGIDDKVGLVMDGELFSISPPRIGPQPCPVRCKGNRGSHSTSGRPSQRHKEFVII
jgi:hypothetical protein